MDEENQNAEAAMRVFAQALMLKIGSQWQIAYEMVDGERTGRWQMLNESGEQDNWWPGWWLDILETRRENIRSS